MAAMSREQAIEYHDRILMMNDCFQTMVGYTHLVVGIITYSDLKAEIRRVSMIGINKGWLPKYQQNGQCNTCVISWPVPIKTGPTEHTSI